MCTINKRERNKSREKESVFLGESAFGFYVRCLSKSKEGRKANDIGGS